MAEYPDLENYLVVLNRDFKDRTLEEIRVASPYFFQYGDFPLETIKGLQIQGFSRIGRHLVWHLEHRSPAFPRHGRYGSHLYG